MAPVAKGEIAIDDKLCRGCGYCSTFCARSCIEIKGLGVQGYPVAQVVKAEKCNACGVCGWMCPDCAITVYKYKA